MQFSVTSDDLRDMGRRMRQSGQKDLRREMLKRMRAPVQRLVPDVKSAVRSTPGSSAGERSRKSLAERPRSLRDAIARGVQVKSSLSGKYVGVRIRVDTRHLPDGSKALPQYLEGTRSRWRHPIYGHDPWVAQRSHPYFYPTIRAHVPAIQAQVAEIAMDISRQITRGN